MVIFHSYVSLPEGKSWGTSYHPQGFIHFIHCFFEIFHENHPAMTGVGRFAAASISQGKAPFGIQKSRWPASRSVSKPCTPGEHQNSWDLWMFIPLKMVLIGIDPYPNHHTSLFFLR